MDIGDLLLDAFGRFVTDVEAAIVGLSADDLAHRPDAEANSIAWLVWHATRVQDDHVAELAGREQAWTELGFVDRFGFSLDRSDTGYGHGPQQVAAVRPDGPDVLLDYVRAVTDRTGEYVRRVDAAELDRWSVFGWSVYAAATAAATPYGVLAAVRGRQGATLLARVGDSVLSLTGVGVAMAIGWSEVSVPFVLGLFAFLGGIAIRQLLVADVAARRVT